MRVMFIRQTKTSAAAAGKTYYTYRLVESKRVGKHVRQQTLLNLGRHFDLPQEYWPQLCTRIDQILAGEQSLFEPDPGVEAKAQHIYSQLLAARAKEPGSGAAKETGFEEVAIDTLELVKPRSVGAEHVCLQALQELDLPGILERQGFNGPQRAAALGNIIGRMCAPRSERGTSQWLAGESALGELLDFDFEALAPMQLYRASDLLLKHKQVIEQRLFDRVRDLFGLTPTVTLYDLTNTYFEGTAKGNAKARHGRSKEKRSDCPLVTLGLVLDASGFIRHSKVFDGNVKEASTLAGMLEQLQAPAGALVIMDAGIATEENITWLAGQGFKYLVVSRERKRRFDIDKASTIKSAGAHTIHLQREEESGSQNGGGDKEVRLYCWSQERARKETSMTSHFREKFEAELNKIAAGLSRKGTTKKRDKLSERIGRLKERFRRIAQNYRIELVLGPSGQIVTDLRWEYQPCAGSKQTHPGVYCLRTNLSDWDDEALWRTYVMLTDLEAVFRCLKSELGMRPIYHHKEARCDGHLFITVLAYQAVQLIRRKLKEQGLCQSWNCLRQIMSRQQRVTATFKQRDGHTLHVRKATLPEEELLHIYKTLGLTKNPGSVKKMKI